MKRWARLASGHTIAGRFVVQAVLGEGRTSAVYRGLDTQTRSQVALKVLDPFLAQDPTGVARFRREVEIVRALDHPNVVKVYELLRDGDLWVICMEHVAGMDAKAYLARFGPLPLPEFLAVGRQLVSALDACHRAKVLHRDLKPQNLLVGDDRTVKLVDFGISRINTMSDLTRTGTVFGTPDYMAPELFLSPRADFRSDVYSAGAVLYELLTGRPPHPGGSLTATMTRGLRGEVEPIASIRPDVPPWLEAIVRKCLRVDAGGRYQSCYELLRDLERGERAVALAEDKHPRAVCLECRAEIVPGLPFCQQCGIFGQEVFRPGDRSVVLYRCEDPHGLAAHVVRLRAGRAPADVATRLAALPVVLARGVSEHTAAALCSELARFASELRIVRNLMAELRLPFLYAALAVLCLLPLFMLGTVTGRLGVTLAGELALVALYRRRFRPLITLADGQGGRGVEVNAAVLRMAATVREMSDPSLKAMVGTALGSFFRLREAVPTSSTIFRVASLEHVVAMALEAGRTAERYELHLSSTSLNEIKSRLDVVERRLAGAADSAAAGELIEAKARLRQELAEYQAIEEAQSRLRMAHLNLQALMKRIEASVREGRTPEAVGAEVDRLEQEFHLAEAEAELAESA